MTEGEGDLSIGEALDLGGKFAAAGNQRAAINLFRGVLLLEPDNFEATLRLGSSLFESGEYYEALYRFWRGLKLNRRHPLALTNYGLCRSQLGHFDEGWPFLERAAMVAEKEKLAPAVRALVWNNLGNCLERMRRHKDALVALDKGIAANPLDPFPHYNRGIVLLRLNRFKEAIEALNLSLVLRTPMDGGRLNDADAYYNRAMARLLTGDLERGFEDYEYRLETSDELLGPGISLKESGLPAEKRWINSPLSAGPLIVTKDGFAAGPLLVVAEQGLGDTIQFLRFLPELRKRHEVVLAVQTALLPLVQESFPGLKVIPGKVEIPNDKYGAWMKLMSAPFYLGLKDEKDIPPPWWCPVLADRAEQWKHLMVPGKLNVGVCWSGNFSHKNDAERSIAFDRFAKAILNVQGCNFVAVQQIRPGEIDEAVGAEIQVPMLTDFRDTAVIIWNMDLVVTVDTSVAHLAATLGKPTWILIPAYSTDWRWQLERTDSPWYPSATLYRQSKIGDWDTPLRKVRGDLARMADATAPPLPAVDDRFSHPTRREAGFLME